MQSEIVLWLLQVLVGTSNIEYVFSNMPYMLYIVTVFACILIAATVAFVFKFLLKLVER